MQTHLTILIQLWIRKIEDKTLTTSISTNDRHFTGKFIELFSDKTQSKCMIIKNTTLSKNNSTA